MHALALWLLIALGLGAHAPAPAATYWRMRLGQWHELGSCLAQAASEGTSVATQSQCAFIFGVLSSPGADWAHPLLQSDAVMAAAAGAGAEVVRAVAQGAEEAKRRFGHEGPQSRAVWEQRKDMAEAQVVYWRRELNVATTLERDAAQAVASIDRRLRDNAARLGFFWVNSQCLLSAVDQGAYRAWRPVHESLHAELEVAVAELERRIAARSDMQDKAAQAQSLLSMARSIVDRLGSATATRPAPNHGTQAIAGSLETASQPVQLVGTAPLASPGCVAGQPVPAVTTQQVQILLPAEQPIPATIPQQAMPTPFAQQPVLNTTAHQAMPITTAQYAAPAPVQQPAPSPPSPYPFSEYSQCAPLTAGYSQPRQTTASQQAQPAQRIEHQPAPATLTAPTAPETAKKQRTLFWGNFDINEHNRQHWKIDDKTDMVRERCEKEAYPPLEQILNIAPKTSAGKAAPSQRPAQPYTATTTSVSSKVAQQQGQHAEAPFSQSQPNITPPPGVFGHTAAIVNVPAARDTPSTIYNTSYGQPPQLGYNVAQPQAQPSGTPPSPRSASQAHHGARRYSPYDFFQPPHPYVPQPVAVPGTASPQMPAGQSEPVHFIPQPQVPALPAGYQDAFGYPVPTIPHGHPISTASQPQPYAGVNPFDPHSPRNVQAAQPGATPAFNVYDILLRRVDKSIQLHIEQLQKEEECEVEAGNAWGSSNDTCLGRVANAGISPARQVSDAGSGTDYIDFTYTSDSLSFVTEDSSTSQSPETPKTIIESSSAPGSITSTPYGGTTTSAGVQSSHQTSAQSKHSGSDSRRGKVCRSQSHSDVTTTTVGSKDCFADQTAAANSKELAKSSSDPTLSTGDGYKHKAKHGAAASRRYDANRQRRSDPPAQSDAQKTHHAGTEGADSGYNLLHEKSRNPHMVNTSASCPVTASAAAQTSTRWPKAAPSESIDSSTASRLAELNINTEPFVAELKGQLKLVNAEYNRWNSILAQQTAFFDAQLSAYRKSFENAYNEDLRVTLEVQQFVLDVLDGVRQTTLETYESEFKDIEAQLEVSKAALTLARESVEKASFIIGETKVAMQSCLARKEIVEDMIDTLTRYSGSIAVPRAIAKAASEVGSKMEMVFRSFTQSQSSIHAQLETATICMGFIAVKECKIAEFMQVGLDCIAKYLRGTLHTDVTYSEAHKHLKDTSFLVKQFDKTKSQYLSQANVVAGILKATCQKCVVIARGKALRQFVDEAQIARLVGWSPLSAPPTNAGPTPQ